MAKESVLEGVFLTLLGLISRGEGKSKKEEVEKDTEAPMRRKRGKRRVEAAIEVEAPVHRKKGKRRKKIVARVKEIAPSIKEKKIDKEVQIEETTPKE